MLIWSLKANSHCTDRHVCWVFLHQCVTPFGVCWCWSGFCFSTDCPCSVSVCWCLFVGAVWTWQLFFYKIL